MRNRVLSKDVPAPKTSTVKWCPDTFLSPQFCLSRSQPVNGEPLKQLGNVMSVNLTGIRNLVGTIERQGINPAEEGEAMRDAFSFK